MSDITEVWRPIEGCPYYEVSNLGQVRSLPRMVAGRANSFHRISARILKQAKPKSGYRTVALGKDGGTRLVHILVCRAFHGPKPTPEHEVMIKDGVKSNTAATNLRWATPAETKAAYVARGRQRHGEMSHFAKITEADVLEIRRLYAEGTPSGVLQEQYGLSLPHVWQIVTGKAWAHLPFMPGGGRKPSEVKVRAVERKPFQSMDGEEWRPIEGYVDYEVSNFGRVRSLDRVYIKADGVPNLYKGRVLEIAVHKETHRPYVSLTDGKKAYVHNLVCRAFHGPCPSPKHEVCHFDGSALNNRADNLRWGTRKDNVADYIRINGKHQTAKLTLDQAIEIKKLRKDGVTLGVLSKRFGISRVAVYKLCTGQTWQHLA